MGANAKLVRDAYAAFGRGDITSVIAMLDENVSWTSPRTLPHGGEFSGPGQVGKFFEGLGAAWDSYAVLAPQVGGRIGIQSPDGSGMIWIDASGVGPAGNNTADNPPAAVPDGAAIPAAVAFAETDDAAAP